MTTEHRTAKWIASAKLTYRPIMAYASPIGPSATRAWVDEHGVQAYATWDGSHCIYSRHPDNGRAFFVAWDGRPITLTDWIASAELVDAIPPGDPCTVTDAYNAACDKSPNDRTAEDWTAIQEFGRIERSMEECAAYWAGSASAKGPRADITH